MVALNSKVVAFSYAVDGIPNELFDMKNLEEV